MTRIRLSLAFVFSGGAVRAGLADCGQDMQKLAQARNVEMQKVNDFAKSFHGKPMDPAAFCVKTVGPPARRAGVDRLYGQEQGLVLVPDEAIDQLKASHAKNAGFNAKACQVASQIKKMKEQAAQAAAGRRRSRCRPGRFERFARRAPSCRTRGRRASSCG